MKYLKEVLFISMVLFAIYKNVEPLDDENSSSSLHEILNIFNSKLIQDFSKAIMGIQDTEAENTEPENTETENTETENTEAENTEPENTGETNDGN